MKLLTKTISYVLYIFNKTICHLNVTNCFLCCIDHDKHRLELGFHQKKDPNTNKCFVSRSIISKQSSVKLNTKRHLRLCMFFALQYNISCRMISNEFIDISSISLQMLIDCHASDNICLVCI